MIDVVSHPRIPRSVQEDNTYYDTPVHRLSQPNSSTSSGDQPSVSPRQLLPTPSIHPRPGYPAGDSKISTKGSRIGQRTQVIVEDDESEKAEENGEDLKLKQERPRSSAILEDTSSSLIRTLQRAWSGFFILEESPGLDGGRAEEKDGGKKQRMDSASSQPREAFYMLVVADSVTALVLLMAQPSSARDGPSHAEPPSYGSVQTATAQPVMSHQYGRLVLTFCGTDTNLASLATYASQFRQINLRNMSDWYIRPLPGWITGLSRHSRFMSRKPWQAEPARADDLWLGLARLQNGSATRLVAKELNRSSGGRSEFASGVRVTS
ncbi:hypothetical protein BC629DRAFT_1725894 [Irpex lacteus]|nr:hypothetical protein BC629DRAFT_1725894 [Irpex lacteus]